MSRRWELSEQHRTQIVERMMKIVNDTGSESDEAIKAARVLISAENQNRVDEQNGSIDDQRNRIIEIVERIRNRAIGVDSAIDVDNQSVEE